MISPSGPKSPEEKGDIPQISKGDEKKNIDQSKTVNNEALEGIFEALKNNNQGYFKDISLWKPIVITQAVNIQSERFENLINSLVHILEKENQTEEYKGNLSGEIEILKNLLKMNKIQDIPLQQIANTLSSTKQTLLKVLDSLYWKSLDSDLYGENDAKSLFDKITDSINPEKMPSGFDKLLEDMHVFQKMNRDANIALKKEKQDIFKSQEINRDAAKAWEKIGIKNNSEASEAYKNILNKLDSIPEKDRQEFFNQLIMLMEHINKSQSAHNMFKA